ncbi:hypothetical protein EYF80_040742 [Liparis tanakae]|uniref:Uncharacterized protein n=1 Tax=Liparis tanakae TaxID=230148 RepID=A0A4Z2G7Z8_9TELE|nr:hypothetical protein EYF80_040742 [Liparis tanakae]
MLSSAENEGGEAEEGRVERRYVYGEKDRENKRRIETNDSKGRQSKECQVQKGIMFVCPLTVTGCGWMSPLSPCRFDRRRRRRHRRLSLSSLRPICFLTPEFTSKINMLLLKGEVRVEERRKNDVMC